MTAAPSLHSSDRRKKNSLRLSRRLKPMAAMPSSREQQRRRRLCLWPNPALHCGMKAAVGAVALGCIRCLNSNDLSRRERRTSERKRRREEDNLRWMMGRKEDWRRRTYGRLDEEWMRGGANGGERRGARGRRLKSDEEKREVEVKEGLKEEAAGGKRLKIINVFSDLFCVVAVKKFVLLRFYCTVAAVTPN